MERCPNCRAHSPGIEQCRRCGMDLTLIQEMEAAAKRLTQTALQLLAQNTLEAIATARQLLTKSQTLRHDPINTVLQGFATAVENALHKTKRERLAHLYKECRKINQLLTVGRE